MRLLNHREAPAGFAPPPLPPAFCRGSEGGVSARVPVSSGADRHCSRRTGPTGCRVTISYWSHDTFRKMGDWAAQKPEAGDLALFRRASEIKLRAATPP
ncbi:MAG: hypothetical protein PHQ34_06755 [Methanothrix sp.]|nr:hypothetical protein [Methanothrix sp.]